MNKVRGSRTSPETLSAVPGVGGGNVWPDPGPGAESPIHEPTRALSARRAEAEAARPATASRTGLNLSAKMTFDKWLSIGRDLAMTANSAAWWLGDWLVYGEKAFTGRYRSAIEQTSLDYKTLRNYAWIARRFTPERRREGLSFGHHAEVAALAEPEQDFWLRKAETLGWSRNELRQGVRSSLREREEISGAGPARTAGDKGLTSAPDVGDDLGNLDSGAMHDDDAPFLLTVGGEGDHLNVKLTPQQLEAIRRAASSARVTIDIWVTRILEQAALRTVDPVTQETAA